MPSARELDELWADESELREALQRSLEPRGPARLYDAFAADAGLGSEWRESMLERETWDAREDLLEIARLRRSGFAGAGAEAAWGGAVWASANS